MKNTLGVIGSGMIGATLARLAIAADIDVVLSNSRSPDSLSDLVDELGDRARAAHSAEAAEAGDLVVVAIPLHAYDKLPVEALAGKTIIDTMNYYPERDNRIPELDAGSLTTTELVQRHVSKSRVIKACNSIVFQHLLDLARPPGAADRSALPIAGDDEGAKAQVAALLDRLGYDVVDTGPLSDSWRMEPGMPVYCKPYMPEPPADIKPEDLQQWIFRSPARPASVSAIKESIGAAARGPAGGTVLKFS